ncbi:MAG TPA: M56 family metallopeptidase [Actinomycetota bacterium]|nr:M56 family metallopeptidase [Actinomycetota bacterium]
MITAAPTVLAIETDSAWVVIIVVSLVSLFATVLLRKLISGSGGFASGVLLALPLALPLVAALAYAHAAFPEISVWQPLGYALRRAPSDLLHLLLVSDGQTKVVMPYALSGSAGQWLFLVGLVVSSLMLLRRMLGSIVVHRLIARSTNLDEVDEHAELRAPISALVRRSGLKTEPEVLLLPAGVPGAFAVGGRRGRILLGRDLLEALDGDELEAIVAHELAHLEAHDVPLVLAAGLLRDLVAWNPVGHLAYKRLLADRELEADRRAASLTHRPLAVASGLLKVCELMRTARYRHRLSLAFLREGGGVKRRVARLVAAADGRISMTPAGYMPYLFAGIIVAAVGLQAGARVAEESPGAVMIMLGDPAASTGTWSPEESRRLRGSLALPQQDRQPQVQQVRPRTYAAPASGRAVRLKDVPAWFKAMDRWTTKQRATLVRMRWEGRKNWEATPLFSQSVGPFDVYRVVEYPF